MPRYRFNRIGFKIDMNIEADTYTADSSWVTFFRGERPLLSLPAGNVALVAELDEKGEMAIIPPA